MLSHPLGEIVEIVGINYNTNGHSCEEHHTCGCVLEEDSLVRLQKRQVYVNGHEQSGVGVYWVSDGVDRCLVGYLDCHQMKHLNKLEGGLCQVTEVYSDNSDSPRRWHKHNKNVGCAIAATVTSNEPNKVRKGRNKLQSPPKFLQMWIHLQTPIRHHRSERDPLDMEQKTADVQRIGN